MNNDVLTKPAIAVDIDVMLAVVPYEDTDNPNLKTHIVNPPNNRHIWREGMTAQDIVNLARMLGTTVVALCGHKWIPVHNPDKFDICPKCMNIAQSLMSGAGE